LVLSPQLNKLAALLQHEVQRLEVLPPKIHFIQRQRRRKGSFKYYTKDLTQIERGNTISFFHELDIETRTMLVTSVSFFNEVATEMQKLSSYMVSFFNELEIKKPCSSLVSFFNDLEIRKSCS
jgi:hypothetical protein